MLFVPQKFFDLDGQCGGWSQEQLEKMDAAFVAAVTRAFELGLESRAAASAVYVPKLALNGKGTDKGAVIARAFESAWDVLCSKRGDVTALEIVSLMQRLCPGISREHVRLGLDQLFRQRGVGW